MKNKKKIIIITIVLILICIILYFFIKNNYKLNNSGNTINNFKEDILNISGYEAEMTLVVKSNKNENKYQIYQKYEKPNLCTQIVYEPENIKKLTTIYDGKNLKIENSKLNLSTIYQNYEYLIENNLWINTFIEDYKNSNNSIKYEDDNKIILEVKIKSNLNYYQSIKKLYIDKKTNKPTKLEIKDNNQNLSAYILYNEIKIK